MADNGEDGGKVFMLRNIGSKAVLDISGCIVDEGAQLLVYPEHAGTNQAWYWSSPDNKDRLRGQIVSVLDPSFCLGIQEVKEKELSKCCCFSFVRDTIDTAPVVLTQCERKDRGQFFYYKPLETNLRHGQIVSKVNPQYVLSCKDGKLFLERSQEVGGQIVNLHQVWEHVGIAAPARGKPATSCHLTYSLPEQISSCKSWELETTVKVLDSADCTYFCVVGWGPAGYSGLQQVNANKRVAIFSMWDAQHSKVTLVNKDSAAQVSKFGGEGEGLKCMRDLDWKEGDPVTFRVRGQLVENGLWHCSCEVIHRAGLVTFMCTYQREGPHPLSKDGFYSFVEDWNRADNATGHTFCRRAEFFDQKVRIDGGEPIRLKNARFTKVEHGHDAFAKSHAFGGTAHCTRDACGTGSRKHSAPHNGFYLKTGGTGEEERHGLQGVLHHHHHHHQEPECKNGTCLSIAS